MSLNTVQVSARTIPGSAQVTASGGYTLPQYAFFPHPALQVISSGMIPSPGAAMTAAAFTATPGSQRPYPIPVYGVRSLIAFAKTSP